MNIKRPIFKKEVFEDIFVSEIGWTLKIKEDPEFGFLGQVYKGKTLIKQMDKYDSKEVTEKFLINIWETIVEFEYNKIKQYFTE